MKGFVGCVSIFIQKGMAFKQLQELFWKRSLPRAGDEHEGGLALAALVLVVSGCTVRLVGCSWCRSRLLCHGGAFDRGAAATYFSAACVFAASGCAVAASDCSVVMSGFGVLAGHGDVFLVKMVMRLSHQHIFYLCQALVVFPSDFNI